MVCVIEAGILNNVPWIIKGCMSSIFFFLNASRKLARRLQFFYLGIMLNMLFIVLIHIGH